MRIVKVKERRQRGCEYCADAKGKKVIKCPYDKCPYKVLDKYDNYYDYLKSNDAMLPRLEY